MRIVDEIIKPYEIHFKAHNYIVFEDTDRLNDKEEKIYITHGYFSNVKGALNKIQKLVVEVDKKYSIKQYIEELEKTKIEINSKTNK